MTCLYACSARLYTYLITSTPPLTPPCPQTFPAHEVLARRLDGRAADVVEAGVQLARERIARLGSLLRGGGVTVEVREWGTRAGTPP
jgi:hypothetical protein